MKIITYIFVQQFSFIIEYRNFIVNSFPESRKNTIDILWNREYNKSKFREIKKEKENRVEK